MPFLYKGSLSGANSGRVLSKVLLADSTEFTVGDAIRYDGVTGTGVLAGATAAIWGMIVEFVKADGSPVTDNGASGAYTHTYTTPASNTVYAVVDVSKESIYSVTADATLATTSGSNKAGVNFDIVAASDEVDESSVQSAGTTAQICSLGPDPDPKAPTDSLLVKIQESQLDI
jgi:hypothetical protein